MNKSSVRIIPFGGCYEIGMNLMIFETDKEILIVDAGIGFPENNHFGVEVFLVLRLYRSSQCLHLYTLASLPATWPGRACVNHEWVGGSSAFQAMLPGRQFCQQEADSLRQLGLLSPWVRRTA